MYAAYLLITHKNNVACFARSGQDWVPPEPWQPGDLPEGFRSDWALLWSGGWGQQHSSSGGPGQPTVPVPPAGGTDGGLPAISPLFSHGDPPTSDSSLYALFPWQPFNNKQTHQPPNLLTHRREKQAKLSLILLRLIAEQALAGDTINTCMLCAHTSEREWSSRNPKCDSAVD